MKDKLNLIIIDHEPYSFRKKSHYYIDEFQYEGWNVEYWGVNKALNYLREVEYTYEEKDTFVKYFNSTPEIIKAIHGFDSNNTIFIVEMSFNYSTVDIHKVLKRNGFKWAKINYYFNPTTYLAHASTLKHRFSVIRMKNVFIKAKRAFFLFKYSDLNIPDLLFITGSNRQGAAKAKQIESLDYFDVEEYNKIKNKSSPLPYKYIVFLDIMLVNHPDFQRIGINKMLDKGDYFAKMNLFFDKVEKKTGLPIVIASHPKANYTDEFGGRLCLKHKTAVLSIHSDYVLTHGSLSISFALFAEKPLVYIYSEELFGNRERFEELLYRMDKACDMLGTSKVNIDRYTGEQELPMSVDEEKYEKFLDLLYKNSNKFEVGSNFNIIKKKLLELLNNKEVKS